jgi:hypothetical protein
VSRGRAVAAGRSARGFGAGARAFAGALALAFPAAAEPEQAKQAEEPPVALERLLKLPDSVDTSTEQRAGATRPEWRGRFAQARAELSTAREKLERAQAELEKEAGTSDAWQVGPPGVTPSTDAPVSYKLRQEIKRGREEVARAEKKLRDLEVEANLAAVPEDWRE